MYRFKLKEIEVGDTDTKGGKKSTVTDVNPETGAITWDVKDVADFTSTYKELEKAKDFLSKLEKTGKSKDDPAIDKLAAEIQELFNSFRTHIRKNYPEEYERISRLKESVNEAKAVNKDAISNMDKGNFPQELKDIIPLVSTKDMEAFLKRTGISFWEISNGRFRFPVKDKKQWHILKMMSHRFADKQYFQLTESVNEQSEQWTQWDVNNINKSLRLALKTFNNLVRNLERLEGELGKHSNKPQGNLFQGMAPDSFDYRGVQNKLNKLYNAFSNVFGNALKETALSDKLIEPFDKALKSGEIGLTKNKELIDKITQLMKGLKEGHGLDQGDLDYLQFIADKHPDDTKLEKIIKFLTKSNILVDKTKDLSKGKEVEEGIFDKKLDSSIATILKKEISDILKKNPNFKPIDIARVLNPKDPELLLTRFNFVNEEDVEEGEGMGYLTPRAFGKMKNNVYTSQYGYKLVPKKIKGSGLEVKQLFEYSDFQEGRISGFDKVEEKVNAISTLLSNAKNETVKFYNENPGSYAVVYSTDMVNELLDDIAEMLKQSK